MESSKTTTIISIIILVVAIVIIALVVGKNRTKNPKPVDSTDGTVVDGGTTGNPLEGTDFYTPTQDELDALK